MALLPASNSAPSPRDRYRAWPAWLTSIGAHGGLCLALVLLSGERTPRGGAPPDVRTAGIVLKQSTPQGPLFAGAEEAAETASADAAEFEATEALARDAAALPPTSELPALSEGLPATAEFAPGLAGGGMLARAGDLAQGLGSAAPKRGGPATVTVFGLTGEGFKFVYAFDRSVSMDGPPLAAAKAQLLASLASLESVHQFHVLFFNHEVQLWDLTGGQQRLPFATDSNKRSAARFVQGVSAGGGTVRLTPLLRALALRPDVVFFLTDADDQMSTSETDDAIAAARRNGTAVQVIEFGRGPQLQRENFLTRLAQGSGGAHVYVDVAQLGR